MTEEFFLKSIIISLVLSTLMSKKEHLHLLIQDHDLYPHYLKGNQSLNHLQT